MTNALIELEHELDRESYDWLVETHHGIALAVECAVLRGATPNAIRRFIVQQYGVSRTELAIRCASAARFLTEQGEKP